MINLVKKGIQFLVLLTMSGLLFILSMLGVMVTTLSLVLSVVFFRRWFFSMAEGVKK